MPIIDVQKNQYLKTNVHVLPTNWKDWKFHLVVHFDYKSNKLAMKAPWKLPLLKPKIQKHSI
jgi:hypothetical protein